MVTNKEFVERLKKIAFNYKTTYMWGVFGSPVTENKIREKVRQYPRYYTATKQASLRSMIGKDVFGFDCVGLIKGLIWGWNGDLKHPHGGARYQTNGLSDIDANVMIRACNNKSNNFSNMLPGTAVWSQGHIGIYIGEGKVIEATPNWKDGVQVSACLNIGPIPGLPSRRWALQGQLPWIEYIPEIELLPQPKTIVPSVLNDKDTGARYGTYIADGVTYAPLRVIAEACGLLVGYDAATKEATLKRR